MSKQYIITDWASNVLQYNGKFNFSAYGANVGSPMLFDSFTSAWDWISEKFDEQDHDEYDVKQLSI